MSVHDSTCSVLQKISTLVLGFLLIYVYPSTCWYMSTGVSMNIVNGHCFSRYILYPYSCTPQKWIVLTRIFRDFAYIQMCAQVLLWGWGCKENLYHTYISTYLSVEGAPKSWFYMKNTLLTEWTWPYLDENLRISHLRFIQYGMCFSCGITIFKHPQQRYMCWCLW